jgi:hypothetical protein
MAHRAAVTIMVVMAALLAARGLQAHRSPKSRAIVQDQLIHPSRHSRAGCADSRAHVRRFR